MTFEEILDQAIAMLQRRGRLTYRTLQRQFQLDDTALEDLKDELIYGQRLAADEDGRVLVWISDTDVSPTTAPRAPQPVSSGPSLATRVIHPPQSATPPATPPAVDAERRQLTVLFCDLVESTALAGRLDPEDYRTVVRAYQDTCATVIQRFDGHIAQYLGDGLLVYFGYPQAHEDDARRAVHTGLALLEAMRQCPPRLEQELSIQLAVRVGIHTGLVVVGALGSGGRQERLALGETPNLAARLQGLADPDTVIISAATLRLVEGYVRVTDLGAQSLKGVDTPVSVYRVLGEGAAQSRLDVAATHGLTPLIGRETEVALLRERWAQVRDGLGQVILVQGEAGIGKSRLMQVLREHGAEAPHLMLECRASPYHQYSPLYPVIVLWQRVWQFVPEEAPEAQLRKLETALIPLRRPIEQTVPLLAALLSLPVPPDRYAPLALSPQEQKHQTLEALLALLLDLAAQQPVLLIVEDLHWIDPSTLEWLSLLLDQVPTARLGLLLTARPDFPVPWSARTHLTQLTLGRLTRPQVEQMIAWVAGGKALPAEVVQQLVAKADGVPLFVEELTKTVLETGFLAERDDHYALSGPLPLLAIPTTLQDALMARLDRLAEGKAVAQLGAVLGRTFPYELLQAITPLDELVVWRGLVQLVEAEVLYQQGVLPQATYTFKHALIQETAYQALLRSTRQQYHQRIAQVLTAQFPDLAATQPELLAHHYTEAGLAELAVEYWQRAGERSNGRSAYVEAVAHCTTGLEVLQTLPDTPQRAQQELYLLLILGGALRITKGFAAPEVGHTFARARELCRHVEGTPLLYDILIGLHAFYHNRGELQVARELVEQSLTLAQRLHDPVRLIRAHTNLGVSLYFLGELAPARTRLDQALTLPGSQPDRGLSFAGQDPRVISLAYAAFTLWMLGYPAQALTRIDELLSFVQELSHPFSLVRALHYATSLHLMRREWATAQARAEAALALSTEQGFGQFVGGLTFQRGQALAGQAQYAEGLAQMRQGLATKQAMGSEIVRAGELALMAEAYGGSGQPEAGRPLLDEALAWMDTHGEDRTASVVYRIQGELLLRHAVPDAPQAEACFQQALAVARRQQTKSLELRVVMSLARLWQRQGQCAEAYELLDPIYGWFTEGFDTADLQEAKALLEALA